MSDAEAKVNVNGGNDAVKSIFVAGTVAFVCALVVSVTAVNLRPYQDANREAERAARVEAIIQGIPGLGNLAGTGAATAFVIELGTANVVDKMDPGEIDVEAQLKDDTQSFVIPTAQDIAGLKRRENFQTVYAIKDETGRPQTLILPIRGLGYASMLYGYLAVKGDGRTIQGIEFYQHGETPGLGARIEAPAWKSQWADKHAYDGAGRVAIEVVKGKAEDDTEVDALTGATRTSVGVNNLVRFWLGPMGYGPYLQTLWGTE